MDKKINYDEFTPVDDEKFPVFEDMGEEQARALKPILQRFITSYTQKPSDVSDENWLTQKLSDELPEKSHEEIQSISREIVSSIAEFDKNLASINAACDGGQPKEIWFKNKMQETCSAMSVNEYGNYLANVDRALFQANEQMLRTIERHGECFNLDGFIAEQQHVNDFNAQAALEDQPYRAYVQEPAVGKGYAKNSFDIVIKDAAGKIIHQYQSKFGKDAAATIRLLKSGKYDNQQILVPKEQVAEVQKAFPGKTVTDHIGGTSKVSAKSKGLTKADVKKQQSDAQNKNQIQLSDWDNYTAGKMAIHLGKNAALTGALTARNAVGFYLAKKIWNGEEIKADEVTKVALTTGVDAGIKTAAAGALKVASEKGLISMLPKGTPAGFIANIAAIGVENCKIIAKCIRGEIGFIQAVDAMARTNVSMVAGLCTAAKGAAIGASIGSVIPVVGTAVGGFIGGTVGYIAGSEFGEKVYGAAKKVANVARSVVSHTYDAVKSVGNAICSGVKSVASTVKNAVSSVANKVGNFVKSIFS